MSKNESVVAVYHTHPEAEQAVKKLQRAGIDMHILSMSRRTSTPMNRWSAITTPATG